MSTSIKSTLLIMGALMLLGGCTGQQPGDQSGSRGTGTGGTQEGRTTDEESRRQPGTAASPSPGPRSGTSDTSSGQ